MRKDRDKIIELRKKGLSYKEISNITGAGKSTISYIVQGIELSLLQKERLKKKQKDIRGDFIKRNTNLSSEEMSRRGKLAWKNNKFKDRVLSNLVKGSIKAGLCYRKDELSVRKVLESLYNRDFDKEKIGGRYIDFACKDLIIEHTLDSTKGISDLIDRFEDIKNDPRKKIAYLPEKKLGFKRRQKLELLVDEIKDVDCL